MYMVWIRGEQRNPAEPEEGYYAVKLVKKGPAVGARIAHGDGNWYATINGEHKIGSEDPELNEFVQQVWLFGRKIDKQEYDFLLARCAAYRLNWPDHPYANPEKPIDDLARRLMGPQED